MGTPEKTQWKIRKMLMRMLIIMILVIFVLRITYEFYQSILIHILGTILIIYLFTKEIKKYGHKNTPS